MEIFIRPRQAGKTTAAIAWLLAGEANERGWSRGLVCHSEQEADRVRRILTVHYADRLHEIAEPVHPLGETTTASRLVRSFRATGWPGGPREAWYDDVDLMLPNAAVLSVTGPADSQGKGF